MSSGSRDAVYTRVKNFLQGDFLLFICLYISANDNCCFVRENDVNRFDFPSRRATIDNIRVHYSVELLKVFQLRFAPRISHCQFLDNSFNAAALRVDKRGAITLRLTAALISRLCF